MEDQVNRQREYEIHRAQQEAQNSEIESDNPELASRLAALRSEIESAQAPHITDTTQAVLDSMQEEGTSPVTHEGQSDQAVAVDSALNASAQEVLQANIQMSDRNTNVNQQSQAPYTQNEPIIQHESLQVDLVQVMDYLNLFEKLQIHLMLLHLA